MTKYIAHIVGGVALLLSSTTAQATIIGFGATSGGVNDCVGDPPAVNGCVIAEGAGIPNPVVQNPNEGILLVWNEIQNFTLTADLFVERVADETASFVTAVIGGFLIAEDTVVSSHYAQWDPGNGSDSRVDTALLFDSDIFAFITSDNSLAASDFLGLAGIDYADFGLRGLEGFDTTEYGADLTRVDISWQASSPGDWTRVITAFSPGGEPDPCDLTPPPPGSDCGTDPPDDPPISVPEPSIIALFALGLFGLGFARRRKA